MIWFLIGFSFSLNVMLIGFIAFALFNLNLSKLIYDKVENNVEVIEKAKDPFRDV